MALERYVKEGVITVEAAIEKASDKESFAKMARTSSEKGSEPLPQ